MQIYLVQYLVTPDLLHLEIVGSGYAVVASGSVMKIVYSSGTFALNPGAATGTERSQGMDFSGNVGGYMTGGETPATSPRLDRQIFNDSIIQPIQQ